MGRRPPRSGSHWDDNHENAWEHADWTDGDRADDWDSAESAAPGGFALREARTDDLHSDSRLPVPVGDGMGANVVPYEGDEVQRKAPVIIAGSGVSMGAPFVARRRRPLLMRLSIVMLVLYIFATGLLSVTPLDALVRPTGASGNAFSVLAGAVVLHTDGPSYHWYVAQSGDDFESVASQYHVQVGGIFELNHLEQGQDMAIGVAYKIPDDPNYGAGYTPPQLEHPRGNSTTVFGWEWWNSYAGTPPPESPCAPNGNGNPLGYHLHSPNWNSVWIRGFTSYHNGVDLATTDGNPIHAAQSGQVIWANYDPTNGLGWSVVINHCNGISTIYGHMQNVTVKTGQFVHTGDIVGHEGQTGWATGPHLHFMVQINNYPVDPMPYFQNNYTITHNV